LIRRAGPDVTCRTDASRARPHVRDQLSAGSTCPHRWADQRDDLAFLESAAPRPHDLVARDIAARRSANDKQAHAPVCRIGPSRTRASLRTSSMCLGENLALAITITGSQRWAIEAQFVLDQQHADAAPGQSPSRPLADLVLQVGLTPAVRSSAHQPRSGISARPISSASLAARPRPSPMSISLSTAETRRIERPSPRARPSRSARRRGCQRSPSAGSQPGWSRP